MAVVTNIKRKGAEIYVYLIKYFKLELQSEKIFGANINLRM